MVIMVDSNINNTHQYVLDTAIEAVCSAFGVIKEEILGPSRVRELVYARHAFCSLVVNEYNAGQRRIHLSGIRLEDIARFINRDHSTIIYSAGTSHKNNMEGRNDRYIPLYYRARTAFSASVDVYSKKDIAHRLAEINRQRILLDNEERELTGRTINK